jgi:hypothetical protein
MYVLKRRFIGMQDLHFSWYTIPKREKYTNNHTIYQMSTKYTKWL